MRTPEDRLRTDSSGRVCENAVRVSACARHPSFLPATGGCPGGDLLFWKQGLACTAASCLPGRVGLQVCVPLRTRRRPLASWAGRGGFPEACLDTERFCRSAVGGQRTGARPPCAQRGVEAGGVWARSARRGAELVTGPCAEGRQRLEAPRFSGCARQPSVLAPGDTDNRSSGEGGNQQVRREKRLKEGGARVQSCVPWEWAGPQGRARGTPARGDGQQVPSVAPSGHTLRSPCQATKGKPPS